MSMPWFKTPTTDDNFQLHAIGAENRGYYWDLLRMKGRGALDQPLDYVHLPHFHSLLTAWVAKCIGLSKRKAQHLKDTLLLFGLINEYWQPIDWEQLHGPRAYRQGEAEAVADDPKEQAKEKPQAKTSTERSRKHRAKQKARNDDATPCNDDATVATLHATQVQRNSVASPVARQENLLKNHNVTTCNENPLDVRALDLDSKSLKAKATRETTAQAPPSTPEEDVTDVTEAKAKATATATATADDLPADALRARHDFSAGKIISAERALPDGPAMLASPLSDCSAAHPDNLPAASGHAEPLAAPIINENEANKEILHADPNKARNKQKQTVSESPPPMAPNKATPMSKKLKPAPISLKHYLQIRRERGLNVIDDDHLIDQWAKERHFPPEFLTIAWEVFEEKYSKGFGKRYAYDYWPQRFFDAVKTNQYGLWRIDPQTKEYRLSQKGLEAFMDIDIKKSKENTQEKNKQPIPSTAAPTTDKKPGDYDGGAWFMAELKNRCAKELAGLFSSQQLTANANAH